MTVFQFVVSPSRGLFLLFLVCLCALSVLGQVPTPVVSPTPITIATPQLTTPVPEPPPVAPNFEATARPLPSAERIGVDVANQLSLTVEQAIDLALRNNNSIEVSRNNFEINEWNLRAARGVYDPLLSSQNFYESATTPTASRIGGAVNGAVTQNRFFSSGGVNGFTPWGGGQYSADFNGARTTTSNTNSFLNPQYPSNFTATYTQPLLRNFSIDQNRRLIQIAQKNVQLTDSQFRQQAIEIVSQVEQAYWNLVFALRDLQVQIDAFKQAQAQLESNQRQVEKGALAPIDVVATQAQLATFEQNIFTAQQVVTNVENTLKTLMLPDRTSAEWRRPITPVSPVSLDSPKMGLEVATAEALKNRPELEQLDINADINQIDQRFYRNQTKPQIDLVGTYTSQGLAGTPTAASLDTSGNTVVIPNLQGGIINSLGNLFQNDYPTYRIGVNISLPWGNHTAKANLGRSLAEGERIANQRQQAEQTVEADVRNALEAIRAAEARLSAAAAGREAANKLYESEQRQFRAGTTTLFLVLQRQQDLLSARGRELLAQTQLNRAISDFYRATGTTLKVNNISITNSTNIEKK
jgi:outer membrane protein TolC